MARSYTSSGAGGFVPEPFEVDGVEFKPAGTVTLLDLSEAARGGLGRISRFFEQCLGPEEYGRFAQHVLVHGTDEDTLIAIASDIAEDGTAFPTRRSASSSDGSTATEPTHTVISSSGAATTQPLTPEEEAALRAAAG